MVGHRRSIIAASYAALSFPKKLTRRQDPDQFYGPFVAFF